MEVNIVKNPFSTVSGHFCSQMRGYGGHEGHECSKHLECYHRIIEQHSLALRTSLKIAQKHKLEFADFSLVFFHFWSQITAYDSQPGDYKG
jgi:hypothetical protein